MALADIDADVEHVWGKAVRLVLAGVTTLRMPNCEAAWELFVEGYGPTRTIAAVSRPSTL